MIDGELELANVSKDFGDHAAVRDLSFTVESGKILALLGPSGSGKTTTLRLIAGFESPTGGRIVVGGRDVTALGPATRRFGMVFQSYALFPHLTVGGNVAFGLPKGLGASARAERVSEALALVDLVGFEQRQVAELSGGQQQRVAVARALAPKPPILLLDEPLSNLDPALRERTRRELRAALSRIKVTTVFVTHEQEEAFALGDVVAVLRDGALQQIGPSPELYNSPSNLFVATFVGRASTFEGTLHSSDHVTVGQHVWPTVPLAGVSNGAKVTVAVRPESVRVASTGHLQGPVVDCRYTGARAFFTADTDCGPMEFEARVDAVRLNDRVTLEVLDSRAFNR